MRSLNSHLKPRRQFIRSAAGLFVPLLLLPRKTLAQALTLNDPVLAVQPGGGATSKVAITAITLTQPTTSGTQSQMGFMFTSASSITITAIGRTKVSGNSHVHTLGIYDGSQVAQATVSINMASVSLIDDFNYITLGSPLILVAGTWHCWCTTDGWTDQMYLGVGNSGNVATLNSDFSGLFSSYVNGGGSIATAGANLDYGGMNFKYHL